MTMRTLLLAASAAALLSAPAWAVDRRTLADFPILPEYAQPSPAEPDLVAKGHKPGGAKAKEKDGKKEKVAALEDYGSFWLAAEIACSRADVQLVAPWNKRTLRFKIAQAGEVLPQEAPYRAGYVTTSSAIRNAFAYWMGRAENLSGLAYTQTASLDPAVYDVLVYGTTSLEGSGIDAQVTPVGGNSYVAVRATVARLGSVPIGTVFNTGMGHELKHTEGFPDLTGDCFPSLQGDTMLFSDWNKDINDAGEFYTTIPRYDRAELVEAYGP